MLFGRHKKVLSQKSKVKRKNRGRMRRVRNTNVLPAKYSGISNPASHYLLKRSGLESTQAGERDEYV
jgi:hypothetical protein